MPIYTDITDDKDDPTEKRIPEDDCRFQLDLSLTINLSTSEKHNDSDNEILQTANYS